MDKVNQVFSVPNDKEGEYFMFLANKFLNHDSYQLRRRGRTPDRKAMKKDGKNPRCYHQHTPLIYSQNFGVYLMAKTAAGVEVSGIQQNDRLREMRGTYWQMSREREDLIRKIANLEERAKDRRRGERRAVRRDNATILSGR